MKCNSSLENKKHENWRDIYIADELSKQVSRLSFKELVKKAENAYTVTDNDSIILRTIQKGLAISWDKCNSFKIWNPVDIPNNLINTNLYLKCLEESKAKEVKGLLPRNWARTNCLSQQYNGENSPIYSMITSKSKGHVSFIITSKAFIKQKEYKVETQDYGKNWKIE
ncbi:hypothetical protein [Halobacteriovorax sp. HLS]|uniref:hypothetical protein n=1 Tax=Halobacteriovorax sp. HLS TaxID=2234000 RepID=UPI000FD8C0A1|nr:hypothetical protein [Halobacteriovorax sp. HLS]